MMTLSGFDAMLALPGAQEWVFSTSSQFLKVFQISNSCLFAIEVLYG